MLTVTTAARDRLFQKLENLQAKDDVALRFLRREGGWKLSPDNAHQDDTAITHQGKNVLLLDPVVSQRMAKRILDVRSTSSGPKLALR